MEGKRKSKKRFILGEIHQEISPNKLSKANISSVSVNSCIIRTNENTKKKEQSGKISNANNDKEGLLNIWFTNADVLTKDKISELKNEIICDTFPDIIAITEIKPKNYVRKLTEIDYKIDGYHFEPANLDNNDSTRGLAIYIHDSLKFTKVDPIKILSDGKDTPKEIICIELQLYGKKKMLISNIYRSPNSDSNSNENINAFFKKVGMLKYEHQIIVGDFNRKDINWETVSATSEEDMKFIEAVQDSFLIQHVKKPTRGRGTNKPSLID